MKTQSFRIEINASRETVWKVLWDDASYREWTSVFHPGSYMVTNGNEGDKVQFLTPEGEGMYSSIARKIPNEFMSFRHLGAIKEGKEQPLNEKEEWFGAMENYTLDETAGKTTLVVDIDMIDKDAAFFADVLPKALQKVKEISERS